MPLWTIYHSTDTLDATDRAALASKITDVYAPFMPRFYVGVVFREVDPTNFFIGGVRATNFVRIVIEHIARAFPDLEASRRFIEHANRVITPFVGERGHRWEMHIDETPFDLWSIDGFTPPKKGTADEARWMSENRASARTHD
jgi:phenylpyruvate tautomerase PptA (4-oxalocrotonate tautomerase family)